MTVRFAVRVAGIAAVLVVAACSSETKPSTSTAAERTSSASSSTSSATPTNTTSSSVAAVGQGALPSREYLVGKWGTNGDCALAIELRSDGTTDGPFGNWTYADGVIGFADEPEFKVHVTVIDDQTMESTNAGKPSKMTRCP